MSTHSVAELRDAWRAIEAGQFAPGRRPSGSPLDGLAEWTPASGEHAVAVVGCAGGVGASIVALALATASGAPARVVECCPPLASGFPAAASAELGTEGPWRRGSRADVLLDRRATSEARVPMPGPAAVGWTILDVGWQAVASDASEAPRSWLRAMEAVVLVTNATVPGLRRLDMVAELLGQDAVAVVVGPTARRWPGPVKAAAATLPGSIGMTTFPIDQRWQVTGLTPDPLPTSLLKAAQNVLTLLRKEPS